MLLAGPTVCRSVDEDHHMEVASVGPRCRRRAYCPRALVAGYLGARSPRFPSLGRCCRRVFSPPRLSRRLPFAPARCAYTAPLACHLLVAAAVALVALAPPSPVTFCARSPLSPPMPSKRVRPRASVAGYLVHSCFFILVAQKEKKTGGLQCKIRKSRFALSNKQRTSLIHESQDQCAVN